jgi:predicted metal-binding protein
MLAAARAHSIAPSSTKDGERMAETTIYVCTTCRAADDTSEIRAGARLLAALENSLIDRPQSVRLEGVECLSVCKRPCTVAFASPGKWTYVYGDFTAETAPETILAGAELYSAADDGLIPWKMRPDALKKGVIARLPPSLTSPSLPEKTS